MTGKKIALIVAGIVVVGLIVGFTVNQTQKSAVAVQTAKVIKQDVSAVVTASGEVKPKTFVNVGANSIGRITHLFVKEGDKVKKGQMLAQLENIQSAADVEQMKAALGQAQTDLIASQAAFTTAQAQSRSSKADLARAQLDFTRAQGLFADKLISKAEFDSKKAAFEVAEAVVSQDQARVAQSQAQVDSARSRVNQAKAQVTRSSDVLQKTVYTAPFDGVVTNLPVHEGETVVMGIQNSPGSTLMTVADMGVITAEVQVDETDIVNLALGQNAEITIDAIPNKTFKGVVTQIGDNAIIRSTGVSTSQSTAGSQEAKDFKVTITLSNPPEKLRPGLSATAKITTGLAHDALAIPIQALTVRDKKDLEPETKGKNKKADVPTTASKKEDKGLQGVFVVTKTKKAEFRTVETGLTGATDIQIKTGLQEGDEIITGSYKVLRSLKNGASVKVDNSIAVKSES
jgi:HlyD family secretion protein